MAISLLSSIDLGGAEIASYSRDHAVALVITGGNKLEIVNYTDPSKPSLVNELTLEGSAQGVDVVGDLAAVAVADATDPKAANGHVQLFRLSGTGSGATLSSLGKITVGALPDSVSFSADGTKLVVANEGEVIDSTTTDGAGSISVIDTSTFSGSTTNVSGFTVKTVTFEAFNGQAEKLNLQGIRISGGSEGATVAQDIEPEAIAVLGNTAWVTLQENNAVAEINLTTGSLTKIWGLGIKDWSRGTPEASNFGFTITYPDGGSVNNARPDYDADGSIDAGEVTAGGLSGAFYAGVENGQEIFYVITDRGPQAANIGDRKGDNPNDANKGQKIFDDPDYPITIYKLAQTSTGFDQLEAITLKVPDGNDGFRNATGIGALANHDKAFQLVSAGNGIEGSQGQYNVYAEIARDAFGLDTESVNLITDTEVNSGKPMFAVSDEYFPQIALFDAASGELVKRYIPEGSVFSTTDYTPGRGDVTSYTQQSLPKVYGDRWANRGFEGMAFNSTDGLLYAFVQSGLQPVGYKNTEFVRILAIDPASGEPKAEYLHLLDADSRLSGSAKVDKIGDAVYDAGRDRFLIIERDSLTGSTANKAIVELDLTGATNVLNKNWTDTLSVGQPELLDTKSIADALQVVGVHMVQRTELLNIPSIGADPAFDKPEGLVLKPDGTLVVFNDNDFVAVSGRTDNSATVISFTPTPIDTSDKSEAGGALDIKDAYGLPMADGIAAFQSNGSTYLIVAGEGDDRNGDLSTGIHIDDAERSKDLNEANRTNLGDRLKLISTEGDYDDNSKLDQAYTFGSRSFRIYDTKGNLVFDSGNQLDEVAKAAGLYDDGRSDDKGMEPEMVTTQVINGRVFAFVGMERGTSSSVAIYDVSDPLNSRFVKLLENTGSISPEGLEFVTTESDGSGFLLAANEVSGTLDTYQFDLKTIGQTTALIPEASTADDSAERIDGQSGDINFAFGKFKPLATVGEVDPTTGLALTGYPDGNAAWLADENTIRVAYQSESYGPLSNETYPQVLSSGATLTGSKIHTIDYNRAAFADFLNNNSPASEMVEGSGFLFDTLYNAFGEEVLSRSAGGLWGNQATAEGKLLEFKQDFKLTQGDFYLQSLCGSVYEQANKFGDGIGFTDDVWLAAEEWNIQSVFPNGNTDALETMGLASIAVDVANGVAYTAPVLGQSGYEKILPVNPGSKDYVVMVLAGYNYDIEPAPLKMYVGKKGVNEDNQQVDQSDANTSDRDKFLARNGLLYGRIYGMAADAATYQTLGITSPNADYRMMDDYLKNAAAPDQFSVRYYAVDYQWDGFDTPEAVKNTEVLAWTKDGDVVNNVKEDDLSPAAGYTWFAGDTKVEHPAVDPDISKFRFVQNMTDEGALLGIEFSNLITELNQANGNLPDYLSADVTRLVSAANGSMTLDTGDKGIGHNGESASIHLEAGKAKLVAPDGLQWIKAADTDLLILDEDSGNDYGERKMAIELDANAFTLKNNGEGTLLALAGGTKNPRAIAEASALGDAFSEADGAEFSGTWNVTGLVATKGDGSFYSQEELAGIGEQQVIGDRPLSEQLMIGVVQMAGESGGQVADMAADQGGQIFQFNLDLPGVAPKPISGTAQADLYEFPEDIDTIEGLDLKYDNVFTGAGDDSVDVEFNAGFNNTVTTGSGKDTVIAGHRDVIIGGSDADSLSTLDGTNNRISGNTGTDDFLIGGSRNRAIGGNENDVFRVGDVTGSNYFNGGSGQDHFWLISGTGDAPAFKQYIMDFTPGEDVIGLQGASFSQIGFAQSGSDVLLSVGSSTVGHLRNTTVTAVNNEANFAFG